LDKKRENPLELVLPTWDLTDLYDTPNSLKIENDLSWLEVKSLKFQRNYTGRLASFTGLKLANAIQKYEKIVDRSHRLVSYAQLLYACNTIDQETGVFYQNITERVNQIFSNCIFFQIEINQIQNKTLTQQMNDKRLKHFEPWVFSRRVLRKFQLSEILEDILHQKALTGRAAWCRLFDETMASFKFVLAGEEKTLGDVLNNFSDDDPKVRKRSAKVLGAALQEKAASLSLILNTLVKDKEIEDSLRGYKSPVSQKNCENQVEDSVVEALVSATKDNYKQLSHRYYTIKAKWFKTPKLDYWDRNAPMPLGEQREYSWNEAKTLVLGAYNEFHPEMGNIALRFFNEKWIDANPRSGKNSGAFSHPTVASVHPYILMNFHGKARDVMTLAHELGHGIHQVLAGPKGTLMAETPLTLAETASVFGEMITFQAMLKAERCSNKRKVLIASKVENMLNTVVRQIAFHEFERRVHDERKKGELSVDRLSSIWLETQSESLGPAIRLDDSYSMFWSYVPHFIHSPFYVYAYAFGDCLVNTLFGVFETGHIDFEEKYLEMLRAGGTKKHNELLAPFNLNLAEPDFWNRGLNLVASFIDKLE